MFRPGMYRLHTYLSGKAGINENSVAVHLGVSTADGQAGTVEYQWSQIVQAVISIVGQN